MLRMKKKEETKSEKDQEDIQDIDGFNIYLKRFVNKLQQQQCAIPSIYWREVFKSFYNNKSLVEFAAGSLYSFGYNILIKSAICFRTEKMSRGQD